jgi:hypothetical protein
VNAVLAARIDRLTEREKTVLHAAAVIGKEFSEPVLQCVMEADGAVPVAGAELGGVLETLSNAEFFYPLTLYPVAEYAFKHPLTQEVAYNSQLGDRRRQIHAAVARAIEAQYRRSSTTRRTARVPPGARRVARRCAAPPSGRMDGGVIARDAAALAHSRCSDACGSPETLALSVLASARASCGVSWSDRGTADLFAEASGLAERLGRRSRCGSSSYAFAPIGAGRPKSHRRAKRSRPTSRERGVACVARGRYRWSWSSTEKCTRPCDH